jgi:AcrR family transcriptional regulator
MTRSPEPTREKILRAAYDRFYRQGYARVSVDDIAEAAGVTKKTLYYHFKSKDALCGAVFDFQHEFALRQFQSWAGRGASDAAGFTDAMFASLARWASKPGWSGTGFTRITMELADLPGHPARIAARRHKRHLEDWLVGQLEVFGVAGARSVARQILLLLEGCMVLMLIHGDTAYAADAAEAAQSVIKDAGVARPRKRRATPRPR